MTVKKVDKEGVEGEKNGNHALFIGKNPVPMQGRCPKAFAVATAKLDNEKVLTKLSCVPATPNDMQLGDRTGHKGTTSAPFRLQRPCAKP